MQADLIDSRLRIVGEAIHIFLMFLTLRHSEGWMQECVHIFLREVDLARVNGTGVHVVLEHREESSNYIGHNRRHHNLGSDDLVRRFPNSIVSQIRIQFSTHWRVDPDDDALILVVVETMGAS